LAGYEKLRVFIAIDIDDPLLLSRIERIKESIISTGVPMKPVETSNIHLTIRFIGEIPRWKVEEIEKEVMAKITGEQFKITLKGIGAFPSTSRPRVVWVGVTEGADRLREYREIIDNELRRLGIPPEARSFSPHITLARIKGSRNIHSLIRLLNEYSDYEVGSMIIKAIRLKKSTLTRSGPIYETLWEAKLS